MKPRDREQQLLKNCAVATLVSAFHKGGTARTRRARRAACACARPLRSATCAARHVHALVVLVCSTNTELMRKMSRADSAKPHT